MIEDGEEIPAVVQAMAKHAKNNGANSNADIFKLRQMHERLAASKENFENGSSRGKGSFSRSWKKYVRIKIVSLLV